MRNAHLKTKIFALTQSVVIFGALHNHLGEIPQDLPNTSLSGRVRRSLTSLAHQSWYSTAHICGSRSLPTFSLSSKTISFVSGPATLCERPDKIHMALQHRDRLHCFERICFFVCQHNRVLSIITVCWSLQRSGLKPLTYTLRFLLTLHKILRWSLITALDMISEGLVLGLPSYMVWQVQMQVSLKLRVVFAFSFRLW